MQKNKTQWLIALAISGAVLVACQPQATKPVAPAVSVAAAAVNNAVIHKSPNDDRNYAALLLPNNLQVVLVSDPTLENAAASLAVGVGSAQDPASQPGLAHYLEHMLFLGTKKYPIPDSFMEFVQNGAGFTNAFTAFDKTNYHFQISAGKFDEALDRFSDYFISPTLDPQFADKERNAVNAEWSKNRDQDNWIMRAIDGITANPENPRSRFSIGNLESLADKNNSKLQEEVKAFYNAYYSANNMRLTLVGKQSIPELKTLAEKYFAAIPNKNIVPPKVNVPGITAAQAGKVINYQSIKELKTIRVDFPLKNHKELWRVKPEELVGIMLGSEEEGTLCEKLRKDGLASNVMAGISSDDFGSDGYVHIDIDLTDLGLANPDRVIASVFTYVQLLKTQGINELYFRELQAMKAKDFLNQGKANPFQQAIGLTMSQFDFPVENLLDADYVYDHFDQQAVNDVLNQIDPAKARIWHVSQNEKADTTVPYYGGKYSIRDITPAEKARWADIGKNLVFNLPPKNTLFTDKPADIVDNKYLKPHQVVSKQGVEAFLAQPEFYREDKGMLSLEINVDFAKKTPKNQVLAALVTDIFNNQSTTLKDRALRASLGVSIAQSATGSQAIYISGYTTKHSELLSSLLTNYVGLNITEKEFSDALDRYQQNLANTKKAMAIQQAFGNLKRLVDTTHTTTDELLAASKKVNLSDAKKYHSAVKADSLIRIYAFGNYSETDIKNYADSAQKLLASKRFPEKRVVQTFIKPVIGKNIAFNAAIEQTDNALVDIYFGDKKSDDEQAQLVVLNSLFQNAFFTQLRTNEQLGYVVGSAPYAIDDVPGFAIYVQATATDLVALKARMDLFRDEFFHTQLNGITTAQIEQFKAAEAASVLQKPTDFYAEAKRYTGDFWAAHYDFRARDRYLAALAKVTKEDVIVIYQKLLIDKKSANLTIQLKGTNFADKPYAKP